MTALRSALFRLAASAALCSGFAGAAAAQYAQQPQPAPQYAQAPQQQYAAQNRYAQPGQQPSQPAPYSTNELVSKGHSFFGSVSRGLALSIEKAIGQWGQPNGYILGQEGGGAFVGGLRYGEGTLYTRNAGDLKVFWQGPSIGWDFGGDGARTMILVYNLRTVDDVFRRFGGISGSAYFVAGFGMTALTADNIVVVPIRSGVGVRLGANVGYLKFTPQATWNPF
ncbi:DUF1134 domain-containing protein [Roseixanthobacter pseudopolyaromaticivorans]|uniref:DUF1134 domain-containing protein n=1 Tax=Xanthobacteraceae TaxID=335928 RepID=UPI00372811A5